MSNVLYIGIDTSGCTSKQGLGTTGFAWTTSKWQSTAKLLNLKNLDLLKLGFLAATENQTEKEYFDEIINWITKTVENHNAIKIVIQIETYIEYQNKALKFKEASTTKLNSIIENWCKEKENVTFRSKTASHIKGRWNDTVLKAEGFDKNQNTEFAFKKRKSKPYKDMIDALRHLCDAFYFTKEIK